MNADSEPATRRNGIILHLLGPAGVGKLAVARIVAPALAGKLVDNHWINNPIFGLLKNDRIAPYPEAVWQQIALVRTAVLTTIATLSPPGASYILTNALYDDDPDDREIAEAVAAAARERGSLYIPIRMTCSSTELEKRIISPDRAAHLKSMDAASAVKNSARAVLFTGSPHEFSLETSSLSPIEAANVILMFVMGITGADKVPAPTV